MAFKVLFEGNPFCSPVFCSVTITHCLLVGLKQQVANIQYLKSKQLTSFGTQFLQHLSVPQSRARLLLDSNCKHKKLPFIELSIHLQWIFFIILFSTSHLSLVCWMLSRTQYKRSAKHKQNKFNLWLLRDIFYATLAFNFLTVHVMKTSISKNKWTEVYYIFNVHHAYWGLEF